MTTAATARRSGLLGAPILATFFLVMNATSASAWCNPHRIDNTLTAFDGWNNVVNSQCAVGGTYANFSLYDPFVINYDVSTWTMIDQAGTSNYAQVGYLAKPGSPGPETAFSEYNAGPFTFDHYEFAMPTLWSAEFKVLWGNTPGKITMYVNGALKRTDNAGFTPNEGEQFSEVQDWDNQGFGDASNHLRIWNSHIYVCGWGGFAGSAFTSNSSHWQNQWISYSEIWDTCQ